MFMIREVQDTGSIDIALIIDIDINKERSYTNIINKIHSTILENVISRFSQPIKNFCVSTHLDQDGGINTEFSFMYDDLKHTLYFWSFDFTIVKGSYLIKRG